MTRFFIFYILFLGLLTISKSSDFKTLPFQRGIINNTRNLQASSLSSNSVDFAVAVLPNHAIPVDFGDTYRTSAEVSDNTLMMVMITSNETVLTTHPEVKQFRTYECLNSCSEDSNTFSVSMPFLNATVANRLNNVNVTILNTWRLNNPAISFQTHQDMQPYMDINGNTYGWVGLGLSGNASSNFLAANPVFSFIFTDFLEGQGSLIFGIDSRYATSANFSTTLTPDDNWKVPIQQVFLGTEPLNISVNINLIFDTQYGRDDSLAMALPSHQFDAFVSILDNIQGFDCFLPDQCVFNGSSLTGVPDLIFQTGSGQRLVIPARIYLDQRLGQYYTNVRRFDNSFANGADSIVLGWPVMRFLYTVFERSGNTSRIDIYKSPFLTTEFNYPTGNTPSQSRSSGVGLIIFIVVLIVAVISAVLYVKIHRAKAAAAIQKEGLGMELQSGTVDVAGSLRL